jgi:hypothetical protein
VTTMPSSSEPATRPRRFERRVPGGRHDLIFRVVFGGNAAAARYFRVSPMAVWRWRHDRAPLPEYVVKALQSLVHSKVAEAHQAQQELRYFLALPPRPPRALSGCCWGYIRRPKSLRF